MVPNEGTHLKCSPGCWGLLLEVSHRGMRHPHDWPRLLGFSACSPSQQRQAFPVNHTVSTSYQTGSAWLKFSGTSHVSTTIRQNVPRLRAHFPEAGQGPVLKTGPFWEAYRVWETQACFWETLSCTGGFVSEPLGYTGQWGCSKSDRTLFVTSQFTTCRECIRDTAASKNSLQWKRISR